MGTQQRITYQQYAAFLQTFNADKHKLRFGQLFCNTFNVTDSELFYNTNIKECIDIIMDKYLDLELSDLGILL